ncbi:hypothetical protein SAMN05444920_107132 [Nonomuraea solani]|uniref:Uncharacterized protein n=1 Tax=Nonomuraea solani TaxID=1144553 RepID=A0A1H6DZX3_9ACTN|nr:hypothetical protein [Nonomuraea solani]SEG90882.1 hypothetical protein SAMN05444920_107132 [Nonomuraea solani]
MSKRSRRRRALPSGAPAWPPGFGPGEPHGPKDDFDDPPGDPGREGGVREPRRPKPAPPALSAEAPLPEPLVFVHDRSEPPPAEVTRTLAVR